MKLLSGLLVTTLSVLAISTSHAGTITCTLKAKKSEVSAKINSVNESDDSVLSDGIDIGKYNYGFELYVAQKDGKYTLDVMFTENTVVQDSVGELSCPIPETKNRKYLVAPKFCKEDLIMDGKKIGRFECTI